MGMTGWSHVTTLLGSHRAGPVVGVGAREGLGPMSDVGSESAPAAPAATVPPSGPSLCGKGCDGNSGLSHHVRVVRALEWVVMGDAAGQQGLGDASGGGSLGQGRVCRPSGIPMASSAKPFARLSYSFVCV